MVVSLLQTVYRLRVQYCIVVTRALLYMGMHRGIVNRHRNGRVTRQPVWQVRLVEAIFSF